jgi:hypothetical protein
MAGEKCVPSKWIAIILFIGTPALAIDRSSLDGCQARLGACYDACKAHGTAPKICNHECSTRRCGLPWNESYGAFLDRRIEENAARTRNRFIGLKRLKRQRPYQDYNQAEEPIEKGGGHFENFLSFFGLQ